ncbi:MAG: M1 family metallopeptidase [Rhodanobacteraceae bacterium]
MRLILSSTLVVLACCTSLTLAHPALAQKPPASASSKSTEAAPLGKLPRWAVPQSYQLEFRSDPEQSGYSGTVTISVDLKKASDHLWLHGKDLKVSQVTVTDAQGKPHTGKYVQADADAGVARIDFGSTLQPQKLQLKVAFSAPYNQTLEGFYKVVFDGKAYAQTQMEPISARYAFPCFDEPDFKTPFTVILNIPAADKAVANTKQISESKGADGWKTLTFEKTRPLPTYLVAWAVGPWDIVDGPSIPANPWRREAVPVRGIATAGNGEKMQRALAMVPGIIEAEENYYGFGYPFGKLDLAALPDFSAGAMENAGLVTYRDWLLLLDKDSSPSAVRSTFNVEAHELAHQWTGDTVTLAWWNDIWLNESFATWMQQKVAMQLHPEYRTDLGRIEGGESAMQNDSLVSARMIRQPITGNGDIQTAFDGITYEKGASVLGMFEHFVGPDVFQKGMRAYIKSHAFGNATADDLVGAIAQAAGKGEEFNKAFDSFLNQTGVPLVSTRLDCNHKGGAVLDMIQTRYLPLGSTGDPNRKWGIPVCVRFPNGAQCQMLDSKTAQMKIAGGQCPAWYMPNADGVGYYRFSMARPDRAALVKAIAQRNDAEQLVYADSIDASFHRGDIGADEVLAAMRELAPSKVRQVALAPLDTVEWIYDHEAQTDAQRAAVRDAVAKAYLPRLQALGYERRSGESADDVLMRSSLTERLGLDFKVPSVRSVLLKQGEAALKSGKDGKLDLDAANPDLLRTALAVAVEEQGKPAVDALVAAIPNTTDPTRRNAMLGALGHAQGAQADVARNFALTKNVKVGEMFMVLRGERDTRAQRDDLWNWFTVHYQQIVDRTGVFSGAYLPRVAGGGGCSQAEADRLQTFFKPRLAQIPGLDRGLAQTHEEILLCSALKSKQELGAIPH